MIPIERTWEHLEQVLQAKLPALFADLAPPASAARIAEAQAALGRPLPEPLEQSWRRHDGQTLGRPGLFFGMPFSSVADALRDWESFRDATNDPDLVADCRSSPEGHIRLAFTDPGWFPFATDFNGNHLGVDLAPGPRGASGQVITFGQGELEKYVLALDFTQLLQAVTREFERGNWVLEPGDELRLANPDEKSFLHAVPKVAEAFRRWPA